MMQISRDSGSADQEQSRSAKPHHWPREQAANHRALSKHPELASFQSFIDDLDAAWPPNAADASTDSSNGACGFDMQRGAFGRFVLYEMLGEGGFGIVFRAFDPVLGREVALKLPRVEAWASAELRDRFLREGQAAAALSHPNILPVHEAGAIDGVGYIVSMFCAGPTLARWMTDSDVLCAPTMAAEIVMNLARAAHHAHERGVLHRDIKPSNVLLEPNRETSSGLTFVPRLTDFGLAKHLKHAASETATHVQLGTPRYMAPEQLRSDSATDVGVFTDVYALGVVLYELLTGRTPYDNPDPLELARAIREDEPAAIRAARSDVSQDLTTICDKCLRKRPAERYRSAAELADDLQRYLAGDEVQARPLGWRTKWLRRCQRHKLITALVAAVVLSVTVGIVGVTHQWRSAQRYAAAVEQSLIESEQGLVNMAWVLQEMNLWAEHTDPFQDGYREPLLTHYRRILARPAPARPSPSYLATMESFRARAAELANQEKEAGMRLENTIRLWDDLVRRFPENESYRQALVLNLFSYGAHLRRYGHEEHPLAELRNSQRLMSYLLELAPDNGTVASAYISFLIDRGKNLARLDQVREAHHYFQFAQELGLEIQRIFPDRVSYRRLYARAVFYLACSHRRLSGREAAIHFFTETNQVLDQVMAVDGATSDDLLLRADASRLQAACMRNDHRTDDAITMFETAQHFALKLPAESADTPRVWNLLASIQENLAELYQSRGQPDHARLNWEKFCEVSQKSLDVGCTYERISRKLPVILHQLGVELQHQGHGPAAIARFEQACAVFERVEALPLASIERRRIWSDCLQRLAELSTAANDRERASKLIRRASEVLEPAADQSAAIDVRESSENTLRTSNARSE